MRTDLTRRRPSTPAISAPCRDLEARRARGLAQRPVRVRAQIGDERDVDARLLEVEGGAIGAVVRRRDDDALADLDAILAAVAPRGTRRASRPGGRYPGTPAGARSRRPPARPRARALAIGVRAASRDRRSGQPRRSARSGRRSSGRNSRTPAFGSSGAGLADLEASRPLSPANRAPTSSRSRRRSRPGASRRGPDFRRRARRERR